MQASRNLIKLWIDHSSHPSGAFGKRLTHMIDTLLDVAFDRRREALVVPSAQRGQRFAVQVRRDLAPEAVDDCTQRRSGRASQSDRARSKRTGALAAS